MLLTYSRHVVPGGWVEQVERSTIFRCDDNTIMPGSAMQRWGEIFGEVGEKLGLDFRAAENSYSAIRDAGFTSVAERVIKLPLGPWAKDKELKIWGTWYRHVLLEGIEGFALRSLTDVLGVRVPLTAFIFSFVN